MGVVDLVDEIGDRQLQLVRPQPAGLGRRRQAVLRAEIQQDVGGLADQHVAAFRKGGAKGGRLDLLAASSAHHLGFAARLAGDIDVIGAGLLQRQTHKLAAPLDRRPSSRARTASSPAIPAGKPLTTGDDRRGRRGGARSLMCGRICAGIGVDSLARFHSGLDTTSGALRW